MRHDALPRRAAVARQDQEVVGLDTPATRNYDGNVEQRGECVVQATWQLHGSVKQGVVSAVSPQRLLGRLTCPQRIQTVAQSSSCSSGGVPAASIRRSAAMLIVSAT